MLAKKLYLGPDSNTVDTITLKGTVSLNIAWILKVCKIRTILSIRLLWITHVFISLVFELSQFKEYGYYCENAYKFFAFTISRFGKSVAAHRFFWSGLLKKVVFIRAK